MTRLTLFLALGIFCLPFFLDIGFSTVDRLIQRDRADSLQFSPPPDSLVNYCTLVRAAFFYGQKSVTVTGPLAESDVKYFNDLWRQVFDIAYYQTGITNTEFTGIGRFRDGDKDPFPPSVLYHPDNPDCYQLFHVAVEVGKINSGAFNKCPEMHRTIDNKDQCAL